MGHPALRHVFAGFVSGTVACLGARLRLAGRPAARADVAVGRRCGLLPVVRRDAGQVSVSRVLAQIHGRRCMLRGDVSFRFVLLEDQPASHSHGSCRRLDGGVEFHRSRVRRHSLARGRAGCRCVGFRPAVSGVSQRVAGCRRLLRGIRGRGAGVAVRMKKFPGKPHRQPGNDCFADGCLPCELESEVDVFVFGHPSIYFDVPIGLLFGSLRNFVYF